MSLETRLPGWLKVANPVIVALQRRGLAVGAMHVLTVPGRRSGEPRTTPVSPLTVDGRRYIVADLEGGRLGQERAGVGRGDPRARPTRAAGRARRVAGRGACCPPAGVPREVPHGVQFFRQLHGVSGDPQEFAALAPRCPVFRVEEWHPGADCSQTVEARGECA